MTPLEQMQADNAARKAAWDALPTDVKIMRLRSARTDCLRQMRKQVHTSRSSGGLQREIDRLDKQLAELE